MKIGSTARGLDLAQNRLQTLKPIGLTGRLIPTQTVDAGKPHGDPGFRSGRALQAFKRDLEHQAFGWPMHDLPYRAESVDGVTAHKAIDLQQFLIGKPKISFADRHEFVALLAARPDTE